MRLVARVTVPPEVVPEAVARARTMLAVAPAVRSAEVGVCRDVRTGEVVAGDYVVSATFASADELRRYATSPEHDAVHDWVLPHVLAEQVTVYEHGAVDR